MGFEWDPTNFGLGVAAGWGSAFVAYRARHRLMRVRRSMSERAETTRAFAGGRVEGRYMNWLVEYAQQEHLMGDKVSLKRVLVEPRFIPAEPFAEPPDEDDLPQDPFRIVPKLHDFPALYAPYNVPTLSIQELSFGERALALLGAAGSGRTTALLSIALWAMGEIDFKPEVDKITELIESEESGLRAEERAARIKERMVIEERARERLALESGKTLDQARSGGDLTTSPYKRMMPVYVHLANLTLDPTEWRRETDPAEPWMRAVQYQVGGTLGRVLPRGLYYQLEAGRVLLLLDGYDELTKAQQRRVIPWISAFLNQYPRAMMIVAGAPTGYGGLIHAGLTPVFLRAWTDPAIKQAVTQWAMAWPQISSERRRDTVTITDEVQEVVRGELRGLTALDATLKIRACFANECEPTHGITRITTAYLESRGITAERYPLLPHLASIQIEEGSFTQDTLLNLGLGGAPQREAPPQEDQAAFDAASADDEPDLDALFTEGDAASKAEPVPALQTHEAAKSARREKARDIVAQLAAETGRDPKEIARLRKSLIKQLEELVTRRVIERRRGGVYQFRHPLLTAALAAQTLTDKDDDTLATAALFPKWDSALAYAAARCDVSPAVNARAAQMPDVQYNHLFSMARWLAYPDEAPPWRTDLFKRIAALFLAPGQYSLLRERAAAALVSGRDPGALAIFERGMKHADPDVRRLSCLGVGALREPKAVAYVAPRMRDDNTDVRLAAGMALGAIGTDDALNEMVDILMTGTDDLRQAVAEMFAAIPEEGYPVLYEAINSEELPLRRAAVFGLRRINAPWALIAIYRVFLEDSQWYVRSAAQQAFQDMQVHEAGKQIRAYPQVDTIPWLIEWINTLGQRAAELTPDEALVQMVEKERGLMRAVATLAVAQLGMVRHVVPVYQALMDPEDGVRDVAHRALAQLESQLGHPLPAPV